jgi:lipooligosaccharide transport system permease protein
MCFTALAPSIDFFNYPQYLFITPMFVLGGTFFPVTKLPEALQVFAQAVLPLTHAVNLARWSMFGSSELPVIMSIVWIAAMTPFFFVLAVNLMRRKLVK